MVGILLDNEKVFRHLEILSKKKEINFCQIETSRDFDLPFKYAISNGNPYMNLIIFQQLVNEGCNLIIYISEMKGIPYLCNLVGVNYKDRELLPEEPIFIKLNDERVVPIEIELRFDNRDLGLIYAGVALDIQILFIKIPEDNQEKHFNLLSLILAEKLNAILISEVRAFRDNSGIIDLGLAILDSFDKVSDSLVYYAKMKNQSEEKDRRKETE